MTKQSTAGHTELPWETDKISVRSTGPAGRQICLCDITVRGKPYEQTYDEALANARLIVTAVNTYPVVTELVKALEACQASLALMIEPKAIKSSSVMGAFTQAFEADCKARSALAKFNALSAEKDQ